MLISKKTRLPSREFHRENYRTLRNPYFSVKFKKADGGVGRVGLVVGTAVHKSAVKRNFWKRQAREALRAASGINHDILLILFPKVNTLTPKEFREKIFSAAAEIKKI